MEPGQNLESAARANSKQRLTPLLVVVLPPARFMAASACTLAVSPSGAVTLSETCPKHYKTGMVVPILTSPPANRATVAWTGCDPAVTDDPWTCKVTMNTIRTTNLRSCSAGSLHVLHRQRERGSSKGKILRFF
jgi:hypothetical protein